MEPITLPIYNTEGKEIDTVKLDAKIFDGTINTACLHQAITAYRANQRKGLASTKTMGEVSGGGRKPWKQKGTGRARVGSTRSPLWRHGGVVFGPHPRDFSYTLPQKIRTLALKSSLNAKLKDNDFMVLDDFILEKPKTKEAVKIFSNLKVNPQVGKRHYRVLLLLDKENHDLNRAIRNIHFLSVNKAMDAHSYEILTHKKVIITKNGLRELMQRFKNK